MQWGGAYIDSTKAVMGKQDKFDVKWELHAGGAMAIVPKIKNLWPKPFYDFVVSFDPVFHTMTREGWPEPVTYDEIPNLRHVPEDIIPKNDKGQMIHIPVSFGAHFFGYRKDLIPFPIRKIEDMLDPRLKGKIFQRDAVTGSNNNVVMYAHAFGGDERNLEPGWDFLKKLAKSGNIGRVGASESDFINSLTTGECAFGMWNLPGWGAVAKNFPVEFLLFDKKEAPGFQAAFYSEGITILSNAPNKAAAKQFVDWFLSPEINSAYNEGISNAPVHAKAKAGKVAQNLVFKSKEERAGKIKVIDYVYLSSVASEMAKKFETEIVPLLK